MRRVNAYSASVFVFASLLALSVAPVLFPAAPAVVDANTWPRKPPIRIDDGLLARQFFLNGAQHKESVLLVGVTGVAAVTDQALKNWRQLTLPKDIALTAACISGNGTGWIGGHEGTLFRSADLQQWTEIELTENAGEAPVILGLLCSRSGAVLAVGTFGEVFRSRDEGRTWDRQTLITTDEMDAHLYAIAELGTGELLIVGEDGSAYGSVNQGDSWEVIDALAGPSLFGLVEDRQGNVFAYGMEGRLLFRDANRTWHELRTHTRAAIFSAVAEDSGVLLGGEDGTWFGVETTGGQPAIGPAQQIRSRTSVAKILNLNGRRVFLTRSGVCTLGEKPCG